MYLLVLVAEVVESNQPKKVKNTAALQLMQLHCVAFALTTIRSLPATLAIKLGSGIKPWLFQPGVPCLLGNGGNGDKKLGNLGPENTKLKQNLIIKFSSDTFYLPFVFWHRESTSRPLKRHYFRGSSTALCVFRARPDGPDCQDQILLILQWEVEPQTPNKGSICAESNLIADQRSWDSDLNFKQPNTTDAISSGNGRDRLRQL